VQGTNKAHENGEAMGLVGVRLTVLLGHEFLFWVLHLMYESVICIYSEPLCVQELPLWYE
jgi:hypothetical protein